MSQLLVKSYLIEYKKLEQKEQVTEKQGEETTTIVKNMLLAVKYIVDFVVAYLQEEIGMQKENVKNQYGNASKEQSMEKKNAHIVKQYQKKY